MLSSFLSLTIVKPIHGPSRSVDGVSGPSPEWTPNDKGTQAASIAYLCQPVMLIVLNTSRGWRSALVDAPGEAPLFEFRCTACRRVRRRRPQTPVA